MMHNLFDLSELLHIYTYIYVYGNISLPLGFRKYLFPQKKITKIIDHICINNLVLLTRISLYNTTNLVKIKKTWLL